MNTRRNRSSPNSEYRYQRPESQPTLRRRAQIAEDLGGSVVVKAQIHAGGRGLAGGVKVVDSPEEAETVARSLLGHRLVTRQTGPEGAPVNRVLLEEPAQIDKEFYLAVIIDSGARSPVDHGQPGRRYGDRGGGRRHA